MAWIDWIQLDSTNPPYDSTFVQCISDSNGTLHAFIDDNGSYSSYDRIYYARSTDNGDTWDWRGYIFSRPDSSPFFYLGYVAPNNDLYVFMHTYAAGATIEYVKSINGGTNWSASSDISAQLGITGNQHGLGIHINITRMHLVTAIANDWYYYSYSDDGGITWQTKIPMYFYFNHSGSVESTFYYNHPSIQIANNGNIVVGLSSYANPNGHIYVLISRNNGIDWLSADQILIENAIIGYYYCKLLKYDDKLLIFYSTSVAGGGNNYTRYSVSIDNGDSWSTPRTVPAFPTDTRQYIRDVDIVDGVLHLIANNYPYSPYTQTSYIYSLDFGDTWTVWSNEINPIPTARCSNACLIRLSNNLGMGIAERISIAPYPQVLFTKGGSYLPPFGELPTVTTDSISDVELPTATAHGTVVDDGGYVIDERGFVWGLNANPTKSDSYVIVSGTTGEYSGQLSSLEAGYIYHYRAYAINVLGIAYGDDLTFETANLAYVTTDSVVDIHVPVATAYGTVVDDGGDTIHERGFVWGLNENPTKDDNYVMVAGTTGTYNEFIFDLVLYNTYHCRAYAIQSAGISYGDDLPFNTFMTPTVSTGTASKVSDTSMLVSGYVENDGGTPIIERGIVYSLTPNPDILVDEYVLSPGQLGIFTATLTGLTGLLEGTLYYCRAFATNINGTSYGNDITLPRQAEGYHLEILEYKYTTFAGVGTDSTNIKLANTLIPYDMIVNETRRTDYTPERGSRLVLPTSTTTNIVVTEVVGQVAYDEIALYAYVDRTSLLKVQTLKFNKVVGGRADASFQFTTTASYLPACGQYVRITHVVDATVEIQFWGTIRSTNISQYFENSDELIVNIECNDLMEIPIRRTIGIEYAEGITYGFIVADMITKYLYQDGIIPGAINAGVALTNDWSEGCISISEVLDKSASASGYQWFIDSNAALHFYRDPGDIVTSSYTIEENGTFRDFRKLKVNIDIASYANKSFFAGNNDGYGNQIFIAQTDTESVNAQQLVCGGTGVYGQITRDSSISDADYYIAGAGTTDTTIGIPTHLQEKDWMVWNITRNTRTVVTGTLTDDIFTVNAVPGQTVGDKIVLFNVVNYIAESALRRFSVMPTTLTFETSTLDFEVQTKLYVNLPTLGILAKHFMIESVEYFDFNGLTIRCNIKATLKNEANFSTHKRLDYIELIGAF